MRFYGLSLTAIERHLIKDVKRITAPAIPLLPIRQSSLNAVMENKFKRLKMPQVIDATVTYFSVIRNKTHSLEN